MKLSISLHMQFQVHMQGKVLMQIPVLLKVEDTKGGMGCAELAGYWMGKR